MHKKEQPLPFGKLSRSGVVKGKLSQAILKARRETLYKMLFKKFNGNVPCFVCTEHVPQTEATLEHILEIRNGGTSEMSNLSISHAICNRNRDKIEAARADGREVEFMATLLANRKVSRLASPLPTAKKSNSSSNNRSK